MRKQTATEKLILWFEKNQNTIHTMLLTLVGVSFLVSDWVFGLFSFGELILVPVFPIFFLLTFKELGWKNWLWFFGLILFLLFHTSYQLYFNEDFLVRPALAAMVKIGFYSLFVFSFYHYVKKFQLKNSLRLILNILGLVSLLIGIYIYIAILSNQLPFEFFWTFTRVDVQSYFFRDTRYLVRMRSLFSEPAHFGYFLNTLLSINLLPKQSNKLPGFLIGLNILWISGILLTFSFSSIFIMAAVLGLFLLKSLWSIRTFTSRTVIQGLSALVIIAVIIYLSWDFIEVALIQRAQTILSGEDNSATERLIGSWQYVDSHSLWFGNGFGNTPIIWNNFAYFLSDGGIVMLILGVIGTAYLLYKNCYLGILFILMNFQRGGYLSPTFSLLFVLVLLYASNWEKQKEVVQIKQPIGGGMI